MTHHKKWTLVSMVRTDLLARAIPWAKLVREHGLPSDLNLLEGVTVWLWGSRY